MSNWELMHTETRDGFEIRLHIAPHNEFMDGDFYPEDAELCERIRSGDLMWFVARVIVSKAGVELGDDYLGACCYDSASEFIAGEYYPDMVETAWKRAHDTLAALAA
jgi:hypothetical protein